MKSISVLSMARMTAKELWVWVWIATVTLVSCKDATVATCRLAISDAAYERTGASAASRARSVSAKKISLNQLRERHLCDTYSTIAATHAVAHHFTQHTRT